MKHLLAVFVFTFGSFAAGAAIAADPSFEKPGYDSPLPMHLEVGTYQSHVTNGYGYWRGLDAQLWYRGNKFFVPALIVDSQTRPQGTQQNYQMFSYANWTRNFYTTQAISVAPQESAPGAVNAAIFFPKYRVDAKAYYKVTASRRLVLDGGVSYFTYGGPVSGQIFSAGAIYYANKMVLSGDFFVNRTQPGNLLSAAGSVSAQYGREGKYWFGATAGGGHEAYRYIATRPVEVNLNGYSTQVFFRKWLTRNAGIYVALDNSTKFNAYSRIGVTGRVFYEFGSAQ